MQVEPNGPASAPGTSCSPAPRSTARRATARWPTSIDRLPYVAGLGFDVLYLPPVHPIGRSFRKGPNNTLDAGPDRRRQPVGHRRRRGRPHRRPPRARHRRRRPHAGRRRRRARPRAGPRHRLPVRARPPLGPRAPGVVQAPARRLHPVRREPAQEVPGHLPVRLRVGGLAGPVDGAGRRRPLLDRRRRHACSGSTTPTPSRSPFWEWLIARGAARTNPEAIFLAEAFTRPRVMEQLAKVGFSQSYTYFTWRQSQWELQEYFTDLSTRTVDFLRPNAWPNTPDILTEQLQHGGRPMFVSRAVLAVHAVGQLGRLRAGVRADRAHRGAGGQRGVPRLREVPAAPLGPRRSAASLAPLLRLLNEIRHRHPALQHLRGLRFHGTDNDALLCYSKLEPGGTDAVARRRQPRPLRRAGGLARRRPRRPRPPVRVDLHGARRARRRLLHVAGRPQLGAPRSARVCRPTCCAIGRRCQAVTRARAAEWYRDAVIYELHLRAFADSNGDGIGDLDGLTGKLDYLAGARRHRPVAAAVLPVAPARRRLRHRRLPHRQPRLRRPARLPPPPAGGPRAQDAGDHRARA